MEKIKSFRNVWRIILWAWQVNTELRSLPRSLILGLVLLLGWRQRTSPKNKNRGKGPYTELVLSQNAWALFVISLYLDCIIITYYITPRLENLWRPNGKLFHLHVITHLLLSGLHLINLMIDVVIHKKSTQITPIRPLEALLCTMNVVLLNILGILSYLRFKVFIVHFVEEDSFSLF